MFAGPSWMFVQVLGSWCAALEEGRAGRQSAKGDVGASRSRSLSGFRWPVQAWPTIIGTPTMRHERCDQLEAIRAIRSNARVALRLKWQREEPDSSHWSRFGLDAKLA